METFKIKFFGTKEYRGELTKGSEVISANSPAEVENILRRKGWLKVHGLKIRKV